MRLIDADAFLKVLGLGANCEECEESVRGVYCAANPDLMDVCDAIADAPTVDAVPVIRCKDCKHRPIDTGGKGYGEDLSFDDGYKCPCKCEDPFYSWMPKDDWFCANGERSEEEYEDENWYTELDDPKIAERSE